MNKILLIILLILNSPILVAQDINLISVDEFFRITSTLRQGKKINKEQWQQFDNSSGYAIFSRNQNKFIINTIKSSIYMVFGNENKATKDSILNIPEEEISKDKIKMLKKLILTNFQDINEHYSSIKSFRDNYDFDSLRAKTVQRLSSFLCCDTLNSAIKLKPIYFSFLSSDGKDMEDALYIDFNLIYNMTEQQRINFLAHEFFHNYRSHFENHEFNYKEDLNFMLDMIQNEGIADQIDKYMGYKKYYSDIFKSPELAKIFTTLYDKAEDDIKQLQTIIVQYSKNDIDKKTMIDKLLEVYKLTDMPLASICRTKLSKPDLRMK